MTKNSLKIPINPEIRYSRKIAHDFLRNVILVKLTGSKVDITFNFAEVLFYLYLYRLRNLNNTWEKILFLH